VISLLDGFLKKHGVVATWSLILATVVSFQQVLKCGFVSDDSEQILNNPFVKNPHLWTHIFTGRVWSFAGGVAQGDFYRPLQIFTYWLICRAAGFNPVFYHAVQLALYCLTVWVVYRIGRRLLASEVSAFAGALLWALHPLHVEAVAWAAAIPEVGCALFYLLGFWLFLRADDRRSGQLGGHVLAALMFLPALFFKELAISFPLLLLVYWACQPNPPRWPRRLLNLSPYCAMCAAYFLVRRLAMGALPPAFTPRNLNFEVLKYSIGLAGQHARLFVLPVHLNVFRAFNLGPSLRSPWPWMAMLVIVAAFLARRRAPRLSFLLLWWIVTLLPCLNYRFLSIPFVADRFSYLPSVGLCLAIAHLAIDGLPANSATAFLRPAAAALLGVLAIFWAAQSIRTLPNWRDNETLSAYSLKVSASSVELHIAKGVNLQIEKGDLVGAEREFETALRLNAQRPHPSLAATYGAEIGLGQIAILEGRDREGLEELNDAVRMAPDFSFAYQVLGSFYFPRGDYARAADYFQKAVQLSPLDTLARFTLGLCLLKLEKPADAAAQFRAAREVDPTYAQAFTMEAVALDAAGDHAVAAKVRREMPKD
jgi:hypothetical protein